MVEERVGGLAWLRKRLETADTDLDGEGGGGDADGGCGRPRVRNPVPADERGAGQPPQRHLGTALGHSGGDEDLGIPRLRKGSYYPDWLLEPRRQAERALMQG